MCLNAGDVPFDSNRDGKPDTEAEALGRDGSLIFTPEDRKRAAPEKEMAAAARQGLADRAFIMKVGETREF